MTDYIKREDALDIVAHNNVHGEITLNRYDKIIDGIYEIPSADVAPVRHGRWEAIEWGANRSGKIIIGRVYQCSECRRIVDLEHDETLKDYPYCHCGAKMDEGDEDAE